MNIYLLKANLNNPYWDDWYNKCFGMVIVADSAEAARALATNEDSSEDTTIWQDKAFTTCELVGTASTETASVLLTDERWA